MFARTVLDEKNGPPPEVNLFNEKNNGETVLKLMKKNLIQSSHDVSLGGIITAISKMSISGNKGIKFNKIKQLMNEIEYFFLKIREDIIEIDPKDLKEVTKILTENSVHFEELGVIIKESMIINEKTKVTIDELKSYNTNWLNEYMRT